REGGGGARRFHRASEAWPGKAVRHSGSDGGGSEPITYYNCLASERSERGAPVKHPSSRRMAPLPITSAVIANFSRPCLPAASVAATPSSSFLGDLFVSSPYPKHYFKRSVHTPRRAEEPEVQEQEEEEEVEDGRGCFAGGKIFLTAFASPPTSDFSHSSLRSPPPFR
ncbi:hypothetical protein X777_05969, partial [Ooceraea biroi]